MSNETTFELSIELILSIYATIVSSLGVILHFIKFRREKPNLHVEVSECKHYPVPKVKQTQLRIKFDVRNRGDRATQLNGLELENYNLTENLEESVDAHKIVKEDCYFALPLHIKEDEIKCNFTLHHTHDKKKFEVISKKTSKSLSKVGFGEL